MAVADGVSMTNWPAGAQICAWIVPLTSSARCSPGVAVSRRRREPGSTSRRPMRPTNTTADERASVSSQRPGTTCEWRASGAAAMVGMPSTRATRQGSPGNSCRGVSHAVPIEISASAAAASHVRQDTGVSFDACVSGSASGVHSSADGAANCASSASRRATSSSGGPVRSQRYSSSIGSISGSSLQQCRRAPAVTASCPGTG